MTTLRVALLHLRVGLMNDLQYRVNFALQVLQSLLAIATGLILFELVFAQTSELNGWTHSELLAILGVQAVMAGIIHSVIQPNMMRLTEEVQEGRLDHALTKPVDAQMLVSVREVQLWQAVDLVTGSVLIAIALVQLGGGVGVLDALAFAVALGFGAVLLYCFWLVLATGSFWVIRMWFLPELFEGIFQTGRWPVGIYPDWLRFGITFLVPIAFAVTVPAEAVTSRLDWQTLVFAALFTAVAFVLARRFWHFGLKHYTGASA
jgi:ABC-2 type transport system permease protein